MAVDLLLKFGTIIVEGREYQRAVGIKTGKIEGIYKIGQEPEADTVISCKNRIILPGAIDIHVHMRDLNQSNKEDYHSGTKAAAAGGITTVVDMPNSSPPTLDWDSLESKIRKAREGRYVNVGFYAGIPNDISEFDGDMAKNLLGLKVYPHSPLNKEVVYDDTRIKDCLRFASSLGLPLLVHPDDTKPGTTVDSVEEFFDLHSCESEVNSVTKFIDALHSLDEEAHLHICHVSCAAAARLITKNRAEERLTAEVTPHHLLLTGADFSNEDGIAKMLPPLRSLYDNEALRELLSRCGVDIVASDHAPHTSEEKLTSFLQAQAGVPGLETTVPLMLTEVLEGRLSWVEYLRVCCSGPARILGLVGKGVLSEGYDADLVIVAKEEWTIMGSEFHSKAKITPFEGRKVLAKP
ncbi:MAG: dihydroorotase family protein, partial [Candidatus Thorarchaeota archaeon]|nr:dihydroorotase family protein [Candidatus Thorarchaeota archaeon]